MTPPLLTRQALDSALGDGQALIAPLREILRQGGEELKARFHAGVPVTQLVAARTGLIDQVLIRLWERTVSEDCLALVAVGGYGRGELHPGSDIDIQILLGACKLDDCSESIEQFLTSLWDIGLEVGHSVRTVDDCVRESANDITVATNLMESRLLAGSSALYDAMREATGPARIWPSREFFEAKCREQRLRYHKYDDTAYNLEPNIKESPGGLRDIQMIGWVAKRHFGANTLEDLVSHGFLTEAEYQTLMEGQSFLWKIRFILHSINGRREDRLLFDYQRSIAHELGYTDQEHALAVEQFMQRYYQTVMELARLNELLLQLFEEAILLGDRPSEPVSINRHFQARNGFLEVTHDKVFERAPFALLEIFLILQLHPELKGVRASTIRLLRDERHLINENFRSDPRARSLFMEILRQPRGITHELRRMNRYGILAAYLPVFANIVGRMQYDLFHVYTVDEHTLFVVRNLRRCSEPKFSGEYPLCYEISKTIPKPELLYIAALFHDIAKGRGGDHSSLGGRDAELFCRDHGLSVYDTGLVTWLVQNHLLMSMTAQRKDIGDPEVINEFARHVLTTERLDYLYLLTNADIRATNPTLWTSWKDALLRELYSSTRRALRKGLTHPMDEAQLITAKQAEARAVLLGRGIVGERAEELWQTLGDDYFLRHTPEEIVWDTQALLDRDPADLPFVQVRHSERLGGSKVFVYTHDHDDLFAATTRVLDQLAFTIVDARIMTTASGYTLDTYLVLEEDGQPITERRREQEIVLALKETLRDPDQATTAVPRQLPRRLKHFPTPTRISFSRDASGQRTVMELVTTDQPGLLSHVGNAFKICGIRLKNAKIATIGARAEDIFFITDRDNQALSHEEQFACLRSAICRQLEGRQQPAEAVVSGSG